MLEAWSSHFREAFCPLTIRGGVPFFLMYGERLKVGSAHIFQIGLRGPLFDVFEEGQEEDAAPFIFGRVNSGIANSSNEVCEEGEGVFVGGIVV